MQILALFVVILLAAICYFAYVAVSATLHFFFSVVLPAISLSFILVPVFLALISIKFARNIRRRENVKHDGTLPLRIMDEVDQPTLDEIARIEEVKMHLARLHPQKNSLDFEKEHVLPQLHRNMDGTVDRRYRDAELHEQMHEELDRRRYKLADEIIILTREVTSLEGQPEARLQAWYDDILLYGKTQAIGRGGTIAGVVAGAAFVVCFISQKTLTGFGILVFLAFYFSTFLLTSSYVVQSTKRALKLAIALRSKEIKGLNEAIDVKNQQITFDAQSQQITFE